MKRPVADVEQLVSTALQKAGATAAMADSTARALVEEVFEIADRPWRGIGVLPRGGLALREPYASLAYFIVRPRAAPAAANGVAAAAADIAAVIATNTWAAYNMWHGVDDEKMDFVSVGFI